jgi:hypothetical protein
MTARQFLVLQANLKGEHEIACRKAKEGKCGQCELRRIYGRVARRLLRLRRLPRHTIRVWADQSDELWRRTKFWKLWTRYSYTQDAMRAFKRKGWLP